MVFFSMSSKHTCNVLYYVGVNYMLNFFPIFYTMHGGLHWLQPSFCWVPQPLAWLHDLPIGLKQLDGNRVGDSLSLSLSQLPTWVLVQLSFCSKDLPYYKQRCFNFQDNVHGPLDCIRNYIMRLTIANHGDPHFKFQNQIQEAKVQKGQLGDSCLILVIALGLPIEPRIRNNSNIF